MRDMSKNTLLLLILWAFAGASSGLVGAETVRVAVASEQ